MHQASGDRGVEVLFETPTCNDDLARVFRLSPCFPLACPVYGEHLTLRFRCGWKWKRQRVG